MSASKHGGTWTNTKSQINVPLAGPTISSSSGLVGYASQGLGGYAYPAQTQAQYMWTDAFSNMIESMFSSKEIEEWAVDNLEKVDGIYTKDVMEAFMEHVRSKFKTFLLAPKVALKVKIPKVD